MSKVIKGLWIGSGLSVMERLCIRSFQEHGYEFHLYTYDPSLQGVPEGVVIQDAAALIPASRVWRYSNGSIAGFANEFKYRDMLENGGTWVDMDTICLGKLPENDLIISSEYAGAGQDHHSCFVILRFPAGSPVMEDAYKHCLTCGNGSPWGSTGPRILRQMLQRHAMPLYTHPPSVFSPVYWDQCWKFLYEHPLTMPTGNITAHLYAEVWRRNGWNKDKKYPDTCNFEQWKRRFLNKEDG